MKNITKNTRLMYLLGLIFVWGCMLWLAAQDTGLTPMRFIVGALAVYQLAYSVARLDGPFDVFAWLQGKFSQKTWIGRGLRCPMCVAFWLGWAVALGLPYTSLIDYGILAVGLAGVTVVLTLALDR